MRLQEMTERHAFHEKGYEKVSIDTVVTDILRFWSDVCLVPSPTLYNTNARFMYM